MRRCLGWEPRDESPKTGWKQCDNGRQQKSSQENLGAVLRVGDVKRNGEDASREERSQGPGNGKSAPHCCSWRKDCSGNPRAMNCEENSQNARNRGLDAFSTADTE